jgi:FKBP-type peptidyl-prolyl cis-trans isomerase
MMPDTTTTGRSQHPCVAPVRKIHLTGSLVFVLALGTSGFLRAASAAENTQAPADELAAYGAVGYSVAESLRLQELAWTQEQFEAFIAGMRARRVGAVWSVDKATHTAFMALSQQIHEAQAKAPAPATSSSVPAEADPDLATFLQEMRRKFGLQEADSGLLFLITRGGSGPRPTKQDEVVISFNATSPDSPKGLPQLSATNTRVKVSDLMPGLAEGVQMLAVDGAALLLVPPELAYAPGTWPEGVKPGTPLMFALRLHDITATEAAP